MIKILNSKLNYAILYLGIQNHAFKFFLHYNTILYIG